MLSNAKSILELLLRPAPNRSRFEAASHLPWVMYSAPRHPENIFGANAIEEGLASGEASFKVLGCDYLGHRRDLNRQNDGFSGLSRNVIDLKAIRMQANSTSVCLFPRGYRRFGGRL